MVLMGHSTGCQDLMTYLLERHSKTPVSGAILQAPVSDREAFVSVAHAAIRREAEEMVRNGRGDETMDVKLARAAFDLDHLTAYRAWSLLCKGWDNSSQRQRCLCELTLLASEATTTSSAPTCR